jgi:uncharacterized protein
MEFLWAICGIGPGAGAGIPLTAGMLMAGLLGGAGHCSLMCGPFALAQVAESFAAGSTSRWWTATLAPYQIGRILTYSALGAVAGAFGAAAAWLTEVPWLPPAALMLAALAFAFQSFGLLRFGWDFGLTKWLGGGRLRGLARGLALGFLPCGLIYGALFAATGAGGALPGALAMAAFGLGTVPALVAVGWLGLAAGKRWFDLARASAPYLGMANAVVLTVLAISLL